MEKRRYYRWNVSFPIYYKIIGSGGIKSKLAEILVPSQKSKLANIGVGGALIHTKTEVHSESKIKLNIMLPYTKSKVSATARIVRVVKKHNEYFAGIEFLSINVEDTDLLEELLDVKDKNTIQKIQLNFFMRLLDREIQSAKNK